MFEELKKLPTSAWVNIVRWTVFSSICTVALSVAAAQAMMSTLAEGLSPAGMTAATILPLLLGTPMAFFHLVRQEQLRLANKKLEILAATDWLTTCLNRRAFTHRVSDQLREAGRGALLVIDVDHFKKINDQFGHDRGDEALQLIANIISCNVREEDLVGRLGGEEFGVFMSEATPETARLTADRIRLAVAAARFAPQGRRHQLSVSTGGALFESGIGFTELFRIADQHLYGAKQHGRNCVVLGHAADFPPSRIEVETLTNAA